MIDMYPEYNHLLFNEFYQSVEEFKEKLGESFFPIQDEVSNDELIIIYGLLTTRYGNSEIANKSLVQFNNKVAYLIYTYAPQYIRKKSIQKTLRNLSDEEIKLGATTINNNAYNNDSTPTTQSTEELTTIAQQHVSKYKRNVIESYSQLYSMLREDYTNEFLNKFQNLFNPVASRQHPIIYREGDDE